jgi:hypothetical protein
MRTIFKAIGSLVIGGLYVACLIWVAKTYDITLAISLGALAVATVAAISNLLSLKWSRDTIRPFLSCQHGHVITNIVTDKAGSEHVNIPFRICNSGSLPATNINTDIHFFEHDEEVSDSNRSNKFEIATKIPIEPMLLPNAEYIVSYILDLPKSNDAMLWENIKKGTVKVRIKISYGCLGRRFLTIQTEEISRPDYEKGLVFVPVQPQKWK